jgi:lipopolysaccharide/colanic/teichoic acid biosynthesis glycosyltransferase
MEKTNQEIKIKKVGWFYFFMKRLFDIVVSLIALIILSPLMLVIAISVHIFSKGPALYVDKRIGRNQKIVGVYKFRSMYVDADKHPEKYLSKEQMEEWKTERKVQGDPRVVPFGRFLRKTSLDELPQLLNIFIGNMSFVGPRPISEREAREHYNEDERKIIFSCRPGLTGYWQVYGRDSATYENGQRRVLNLEYFQKRSLWLDFKLIMLTFVTIFKHEGAQD